MTDFPDVMPQKSATWATLCYDRSPEFKVHSARGLALNAIGNKKPTTEIALYENQNGVWTKVWEWKKPEICECGRSFKGDKWGRGKYYIDPEFEGTIKDAPVICQVCYTDKKEFARNKQTEERERQELARLLAKHGQPERYGRIGGLENLTAKD